MRLILSIILSAFVLFVYAQQPPYVLKRSGSSLFIEHKVVPKENWYSVGRIYMISPREIAAFNGLSIDKGLGIGQVLEIPLMKSNFSQLSDAAEGGVPVVHLVQPKEALFRLANKYQVDIALLKKWNGLKTDQVNSGQKLIVGYIKPAAIIVPAESILQQEVKQGINQVVQAPTASVAISPVLEKEKAIAPSAYAAPIPNPAESLPVQKPLQPISASNNPELKDHGVGQFFPLFTVQSKEGALKKIKQPIYGIFKSTSGWQDGKYYVLMNDVVPGTVVRIVVAQSGKEIYAKVLAPVPLGKESEGMVMRMSSASAIALNLGEATNGDLEIVWYN